MKIAVIGSREFSNYPLLVETMNEYIPDISLFISGGAKGADSLGERWAKKNGIATQIFYPQHGKYKHPYHQRNRLIAENADLVVAFWNGSSGTRYTIEYARKLGKPVRLIRF